MKADEMIAIENEAILDYIDLIMDPDLNQLDKGNQYYMQNLKVLSDSLYENLSEQILKLNSLTDEEQAQSLIVI